ncbi:MAG: hypothetical protein ACQRW7_10015 [Caulobacterales bacterium]|uniref:hypothetical protein n=1 Tax=Glycocaulis sp. TaxID=1969725 RepID=UPI003FA0BCCA
MMRRFLSDTAGAAAPLMACAIAAGSLLLVFTLTQVMDHLHKRELQATADLIALLAVRDSDYSIESARTVLSDQGFDPEQFDIVVEPGLYEPDASLAPAERFTSLQAPYNAAHVELRSVHQSRVRVNERRWRARAEATAARQDMVSFAIASRLVRLEGGYSGAVLAALTGYSGAITVMDYRSLADARISVPGFLDALKLEAGLTAVSYDALLDSNVRLSEALNAAVTAMGSDAPALLDVLARQSAHGTRTLRVGDILSLAPGMNSAGLVSGAQVGLADLVMASALAAQGGRQIGVAVSAPLASVTLGVGQPPQEASVVGAGLEGAQAHTRQLELDVSIGAGLGRLNVEIEDAVAEARLVQLTCNPDGTAEARFAVITSPARARIGGALGLLGSLLSVDLSSGRTVEAVLTSEHVESGRPEVIRSGLGAQVNLLGLGLPLSGVLNSSLGLVDALLTDLGLTIAESELYLREVRCGRPFLVG